MTLAACTIVSKNYLPYARVLARSFRRQVPGGRFFVLLVDRNDGYVDPAEEPFELVEAEELGNLPRIRSFLFKYTILEANTAVKPFFLEELLERHDLETLVYFDPDILITGSLDELAARLAEHSVVLTPHLTDPIDDDRFPTEQAILQAGSHNLGFVALRHTPTSRRLLRWWQDRLYDDCVVRIEDGLFVDQKWMDLAPGLFSHDGGTHLLVDPGYNVAYWNLHGRSLASPARSAAESPAEITVNGKPLIFFHFSGIDPESLEPVSKHQDRFRLADLDATTRELYRHYADRVRDEGYAECRPWPYAYGHFREGAVGADAPGDGPVPIPDLARALYLEMDEAERDRFGDPFDEPGFFRWLQEPVTRRRSDGHLTRLLAEIHARRADLRAAYPDPAGRDFAAFSSWMRDAGRYENRLHPVFLRHLHDDSESPRWTPAGLKRRVIGRARRIYHSAAGRKTKATVKRWLGPERTKALKKRLRPTPPSGAPATVAAEHERLGLDLWGYLDAETGMGEAARSLARAFETTPVPVTLHSLDLNVLARRGDDSLDDRLEASDGDSGELDVRLFVVNADQVPPLREHLADRFPGGDLLGPRRSPPGSGPYEVALWLWEQDAFPEEWRASFEPFDEIWTPSGFCVDAIGEVSPVPVRRVPLPVEPSVDPSAPEPSALVGRGAFGLPDDAFVFLYVFNYLSFFERKNPLAAVEAFRRAFGDDPSKVLVLKTAQSDFAPEDAARLEEAASGAANVRLVDRYLSRAEMDSLMRIADAYVSLHRSEGFGLTLAEAMSHAKPVIATPYGGVTDFFGVNNGFPVRYELVELEEDLGPYRAGSRWADPDVEHAAEQMRRVARDDDARRRVGERARRDVRDLLSHEAVGRILQRRFDEIVRRRRRGRPMRPPR